MRLEQKILNRALWRLKKYGWRKFSLGELKSPCCATGHCAFAVLSFGKVNKKAKKIYIDRSHLEAFENVDNLLGSIVGQGVIHWNDTECKDEKECVKLFETAIEVLEAA